MQTPGARLRFLIGRVLWVRDRFVSHHMVLQLPGRDLRDPAGKLLGRIEGLRLVQGRLHLSGWARADAVLLRLGTAEARCRPGPSRASAPTAHEKPAFSAALPMTEGLALTVELALPDGQRLSVDHPLRLGAARRWAMLTLNLRFARRVLGLVPDVLAALRKGDPDLNRRIKVALDLAPRAAEVLLDARMLGDGAPPPATPGAGAAVATILMPVHNAFGMLPEALDRVVRNTDVPWHLILVEDASTDPAVRPWLRDWVADRSARGDRVTLLENDANLGFIGSVNRGMAEAERTDADRPLVLLNSDAMVPPGWASRLLAPLADPTVATVTPLSNDAEIFTIPVICTRSPLAPGQADRIDAALRRDVSPDAPRVTAPTGVGFCMAIGPGWLERIGRFDPVFGRGYGEEVDWCRRAAARGGQHVAAANLFVEHRGGASFGPEKAALLQANSATLSRRYRDYDQSVQDFITQDPLGTARLIGALAWAEVTAPQPEVPIYIAHALGGGAETYLQARRTADPVSVTLRFGGAARCRIEVAAPTGTLTADTDDPALAIRVLRTLGRRRIVYSCAVGDPDLAELPGLLCELAGAVGLEILFHDYLPISPSYLLLSADGRFHGLPDPATDDPAHSYTRPDGQRLSLRDWRALWRPAIERADRLVVFSADSARIVAAAWPEAAGKLVIAPHRLPVSLPRLQAPASGRKVIGVLGAIGPQKGAAVLSALAARLQGRPEIGLALIGYIAPGHALGSTPVHGPYAVEDVPALAARYGVSHWLIPSIWPETFSYTVHECLATGLPVLAFDLGAQGDAVRAAPNGIVVPWHPDRQDPEHLAQSVLDALRS